ncbi:MAG TPA: BREX-2 system phosphatase PglZ [Streptosporangiaceae bacterium]|nr:BREX-2 system phosphatase PglZ [Streptosporangiaceae bacterium]
MTEQTVRMNAPEANEKVVEGELRRALKYAERRRERHGPRAGTERVLLLRAAPEWRGPEALTVEGGDGPVHAVVRGCGTVLAVLDALSEPREPETYLVVLTPCEDGELGTSVLAQAIGNATRLINRWDLVADAFGARKLDPRLTGRSYRWLAEALIEVGSGGRRLAGPVLQFDTALARLAAVRLGKDDTDERLDAAALLEWSLDRARVARFVNLRDDERAGLTGWLETSIGPVAQIVFRLLANGEVTDAVAFGLAAAELYPAATGHEPLAVRDARIRAEERFLGQQPVSRESLAVFAEAAESLVLRWSDTDHAAAAQATCDRAQGILAELGAADLAEASRVLDAGMDARLGAVGEEIGRVLGAGLPTEPPDRVDPAALASVEDALDRLHEHRRIGDRADEVAAATMAVRLVRWLAEPTQVPATVAEAMAGQVRSWGWADRAVGVVWNPDTARVRKARGPYAALYEAVRAKKNRLDRAFAERLRSWSSVAAETGELLLAENLMDRIARPVAERAAPLIIVLDGMSMAVACELAQEIAANHAWLEVGRYDEGREGALAAIPSITRYSRTSLFCGVLRDGGQSLQSVERAGFAAFWRGRRSELFHKAGLRTDAGARLHDNVEAAINEPGTVVGVVLNTIDDGLRDDERVSDQTWHLRDVDYLPELLRAAATASRPVILTSDHGHVLDRDTDMHPASGDSARHRTGGEPGDGEVAISGRRVLAPGGHVVVPYDEGIRYRPRRAGYHGGVALAEMVIPVLVFVPSPRLCPKGWSTYDNPSLHEPAWWEGTALAMEAATEAATRTAVEAATVEARKSATPRTAAPRAGTRARTEPQDTALFSPQEIEPERPPRPQAPAGAAGAEGLAPGGLGARVVASELFAGQRAFVRKAPEDAGIAALIDGLAAAGGKLPVAAAARAVGQPPFRMAGYLSQVGRLLNVDGYPVIGETDGGRTVELNVTLLKEQFLGGG